MASTEASPTLTPELQDQAQDLEHRSIKETDWTHLSVSEIRRGLTQRIQSGMVLHGSPVEGLQTLVPTLSKDATAYKQHEKVAVFATDQPLVALFRGAFGSHLVRWSKAAFFQVDINQIDPNTKGYVYLCDADQFSQEILDASEFTTKKKVIPNERITISTAQLLPFVRTQEQVATDFSLGVLLAAEIIPEKVRVEDCQLVLETVISMVKRIGYIDYTYDPSKPESMDLRDRLDRVLVLLETQYHTVLTSKAWTDASLEDLKAEAKRASENCTYGMYSAFDVQIEDMALRLARVLEN